MSYAVDVAAAVLSWVQTDHPPLHRVDAFQQWAKGLETGGPPPVYGYSPSGLQLALGPNNEMVEFDVVATPLGLEPPYAIIAIKSISTTDL